MAATARQLAAMLENKLSAFSFTFYHFCVFFREVINLTEFLRNTTEKESNARAHLEDFINGLINRAERAENELNTLRRPQGHYSSLPPQPVMNNHMGMDFLHGPPSAQMMRNNQHPVMPVRNVDANHPVEQHIVPFHQQRNFKVCLLQVYMFLILFAQGELLQWHGILHPLASWSFVIHC
jgi:hypothetical protein